MKGKKMRVNVCNVCRFAQKWYHEDLTYYIRCGLLRTYIGDSLEDIIKIPINCPLCDWDENDGGLGYYKNKIEDCRLKEKEKAE